MSHQEDANQLLSKRLKQLNSIGISLSVQKDRHQLMEQILLGAKDLTGADGGTLYTLMDGKLKFEIVRTDSLGIAWGGSTADPLLFPDISLYDNKGAPNIQTVVGYAAVNGSTVKIPDIAKAKGFDFTGTRQFDARTGYRSQSFLTVPMKNHEGIVIGVLQLINAYDKGNKKVVPFSDDDCELAESLASQAAIAMTNYQLIENLEKMLESFIHSIADAIDQKSPYTGQHCRRVPVIAMLLADAINKTSQGAYKDFQLSKDDLYELKIASWLHDCGKVTTPVHIVDKSTRLETIVDRIHWVDTRFEVLRRDAEIQCLEKKIACLKNGKGSALPQCDEELKKNLNALAEEQAFIRRCNQGSEFIDDNHREKIKMISKRRWIGSEGAAVNLLSSEETDNLSIARGTLNASEREVINNHVVATLNMLKKLPYPKYLRNVPEIAGSHHERVDGKGYPRGLTGSEMSVQARLLCIADVFEALTSRDRPYKKAIPLSKSIDILREMSKSGHIDPEILDVFIKEKVYLDYAHKYLLPQQIDIH